MMDVFVVRAFSLASTARPLIASSLVHLWEYSVVCTYCMDVLPPVYFLVTSPSSYGVIAGSCCICSCTPYDVTGTSFPRVLLLALLEVFKGPWPFLGGRGEMAMVMMAGLHVSAVHQMLSLPSSCRVSFNAQRSDSQKEDNSTRGDQTSRGSPVPGPTGSTWALERSDERHAQLP